MTMDDLHFAQIREDSWIERGIADSLRPERVAVVASGGCTALSVLDDDVQEVLAFDLSVGQCALLELRKIAIAQLDRAEYLRFIGERPCAERLTTWSRLAHHLHGTARRYWDGRLDAISEGIQYAGSTERFYRHIASHMRGLLGEDVLYSLFTAPSLPAQREIYHRSFGTTQCRTLLKVLLSKSSHLLFFPAIMFLKAEEHDFAAFFHRQFEHEATSKPLQDNYFLSQLLFGHYLHDQARGLPPYLTEQGYLRAQRNLHKLRVRCAPLHTALHDEPALDACFLSNVFDWCSPELMGPTSQALLRALRPGATLFYRNMLSESELPLALRARFERDAQYSQALRQEERSMLYRNLSVGILS